MSSSKFAVQISGALGAHCWWESRHALPQRYEASVTAPLLAPGALVDRVQTGYPRPQSKYMEYPQEVGRCVAGSCTTYGTTTRRRYAEAIRCFI